MVWQHLTIILLIFQLQDSEGGWASETEGDVKTKLLEYGYGHELIEPYLAEREEITSNATAVSPEMAERAIHYVESTDRVITSSPSPGSDRFQAAMAADTALGTAGFSQPLRHGIVRARKLIEARRRQLRTSHRERGENSAGTSNAESRQDTTETQTSKRKGFEFVKEITKSFRKGP